VRVCLRAGGRKLEIGWFQVENLFLSRNLFYTLFDLRKKRELTGMADIDQVLKSAVALDESQVEGHLVGQNAPKHHPILLICENGKCSRRVARRLEAGGYTQVYVLEDGEAAFSSSTK
jgi:rhodanese-related sulfurtransferase